MNHPRIDKFRDMLDRISDALPTTLGADSEAHLAIQAGHDQLDAMCDDLIVCETSELIRALTELLNPEDDAALSIIDGFVHRLSTNLERIAYSPLSHGKSPNHPLVRLEENLPVPVTRPIVLDPVNDPEDRRQVFAFPSPSTAP
jgi:hypothetical protein